MRSSAHTHAHTHAHTQVRRLIEAVPGISWNDDMRAVCGTPGQLAPPRQRPPGETVGCHLDAKPKTLNPKP